MVAPWVNTIATFLDLFNKTLCITAYSKFVEEGKKNDSNSKN